LLLVTAAVYSGLWSAGFVWDDIPLILQNQSLADASLWSIFTGDLWADSGAGSVSSGYYRPMVLLSFAFDRQLFGLEPGGYHLHSLAWHLAAVTGLVALLKDLVGREGALVGGAVFALHPVQSEVVAWVAARNDLMAAAIGFAALGMVWRDQVPSRWRRLGAGVLTVLAALSKETAFVLPLMLLTADMARGRQTGRWLRVLPLVVGVSVVLAIRFSLGVGQAVVPSAAGVSLLAHSFPSLVGVLGVSVLSPWPLSSARDLAWIGLEPGWRVGLGLVFVFSIFLSLVQRRRRSLVGLGILWTVLLVGVTLVPIADKGGFGDRFLYWPMAGLALLLGATAASRWRLFIPAMAIPSLFLIHVRIPDWAHDRALWGAAMRDVPTPTNAVSLGHALTLHARHKRAHVTFVGALAGEAIDTDACAGVVGSAMRAGLTAHALRMGLWAEARGCPPSGALHGWMSMAAALEGRWGLAQDWSSREPSDSRQRDGIVRAAIAKRDGDLALFQSMLSDWNGADPLLPQVEAVLLRSGLKAVRPEP
jgi:hypothetical protein